MTVCSTYVFNEWNVTYAIITGADRGIFVQGHQANEANNFQVLSLQTLGTKLVTNLFCYVHPQRHDTNGTDHILLVTASSPVRFSLALEVGKGSPHLQSQGKAPWERGCTRKGPSFETIVPSVNRQNSYVQIYSNADQIS